METHTWIAFAALLFTIATTGGGIVWKVAANKTEIVDRIMMSKSSTDLEIDGVHKRIDQTIENLRRDLEASERRGAEPVFAIREKVANVELFLRDHYVSKREYEKDHTQLLLALREMQDHLTMGQDRMRQEIEKRLDAYEERVERAMVIARNT